MSLILSKSKSLVENIPWITNEFWMSESSTKFTLQNPYHYQLQNTGIDHSFNRYFRALVLQSTGLKVVKFRNL